MYTTWPPIDRSPTDQEDGKPRQLFNMPSSAKKVNQLTSMFEGLISPRSRSNKEKNESDFISPLPGEVMAPTGTNRTSPVYGPSQTPHRQLKSAISLLSLRERFSPEPFAEHPEPFSWGYSGSPRREPPKRVLTTPGALSTKLSTQSSDPSTQSSPFGESLALAEKPLPPTPSEEQEKYCTPRSTSYLKKINSRMATEQGSPSNSSFKSFDSNLTSTTKARSMSSRSAKSAGDHAPAHSDSLPSPSMADSQVLRPYTIPEMEDMFGPKEATPTVPSRTSKRTPTSQDWINSMNSGRGIMRGKRRGKSKTAEVNEATDQQVEDERKEKDEVIEESSPTETKLQGLGITSEIRIHLEVMEEEKGEVESHGFTEETSGSESKNLSQEMDNTENDRGSSIPKVTQPAKQVVLVEDNLHVGTNENLGTQSEGEVTANEALDGRGLGINFCNRDETTLTPMTKKSTPDEAASKDTKSDASTPKSTKKPVVLPTFAELDGLYQEGRLEGLGFHNASVLAEAQATSSPLSETDGSGTGYDYEPHIKPGDSADTLLEELLEENYRGQVCALLDSRTPRSQALNCLGCNRMHMLT